MTDDLIDNKILPDNKIPVVCNLHTFQILMQILDVIEE
jgi:hypothetical protein